MLRLTNNVVVMRLWIWFPRN